MKFRVRIYCLVNFSSSLGERPVRAKRQAQDSAKGQVLNQFFFSPSIYSLVSPASLLLLLLLKRREVILDRINRFSECD